jgi:flagellar biosynthetic protein FlhB
MSDQDQSERTEEPSPHRLQQGRERGQVAVSQDVKTWAVLAAAALSVAALLPMAATDLTRALIPFVAEPDRMAISASEVVASAGDLAIQVGWPFAGTLALLVLFPLLAGFVQVGPLWAPSRIKPDFAKISPLKGVARLFSTHAVVELTKGLIKIASVSLAAFLFAVPLFSDMESWPELSAALGLRRLDHIVEVLLICTTVITAIVAVADLVYQRFAFLKQMRMTKQEVREEFRQTEGDPQIKARIRRLRQERSRRRMMAAVPDATVVITNPTHYAVALAYEMVTMPAPKVVAKGADLVAQRIREVATEHEVPVVENAPLARALYGAVEIDQEIPPEHYQAVAQIIGYVMRLDERRQAS